MRRLRLRDMELGYPAKERKNLPKMIVRLVIKYNRRPDIRRLYPRYGLSNKELNTMDNLLESVMAVDRGLVETGIKDYTKALDTIMSNDVLSIVLYVCLAAALRDRLTKRSTFKESMRKNVIAMRNMIGCLDAYVRDILVWREAVRRARFAARAQ